MRINDSSPDSVPFNVRLWTISDIAQFVRCSRDTVTRLKSKPGFPKAIRIGRGHPRWKAVDVVRWADRQEVK